MTDQKRRDLKPGELFAIDPKYLQRDDRGAFFWLFGSPLKRNEYHGEVAVVYVHDALDHHEGWCDSYDAIVDRVDEAIKGEAECKQWDEMVEWYGVERTTEKKGPRPEPTPAKTIVLSLDTPGGVVSGLNQTVEKLRRMCEEKSVKLVAFVNEKACSAGYALACACSEIYAPPSAIVGSIGVRSMMCDQTKADSKAGLKFVLIASGERKLDGDPHIPVSDAAVREERKRVDYLAAQFFQLVGKARGKRLSPESAQALQATVLIGKKAEKAGLTDATMGWDALLAKLQTDLEKPAEKKPLGKSGSGMTPSAGSRATQEPTMRLTKKIDETKKAIASEKDAKKKTALQAKLVELRADDAVLAAAESLKKTRYKHETEEETTEEDAPEEEEESTDEDAEDDKDEDADDPDKDKDAEDEDKDKDAEGDDDDKDAEGDDKDKDAEDEKSEDEALSALTSHLKGKAKQSALGFLSALIDKASAYDKIQPTVAALQQTEASRKKSALIDDALKGRRITKKHAKDLRGKPLAFVRDFLKMHTKALYFTADDAEVPRDASGAPVTSDAFASVPQDVMSIINASVFTQAPNDPKKQEELRSASVKAWRESQNGARH